MANIVAVGKGHRGARAHRQYAGIELPRHLVHHRGLLHGVVS